MNKIYAFCLLLLSFGICSQTIKDEKLEDWVFPQKNNFIRMKSNRLDTSPSRTNYFKIQDRMIGISFEVEMMNSDPAWKLFILDNEVISLVKVKEGAFGDMGGNEYSFGKDNVYWKLPPDNEIIEWNYTEGEGSNYHCKSYWKNDKEKLLVVERIDENFNSIEYYSKGLGLIKKVSKNISSNKINESYTLLESDFDPEIVNENFPLTYKFDDNKPSESKKVLKIDNEQKIAVSYLDGTIPKEYKIQIIVDKGLPYDVKDSISVKNNRGIGGISSPRYIKSENAVYYNGEQVYGGGIDFIKEIKITKIIYYKQPFSFKLDMYYCDGEGNFRRVENKKLFFENVFNYQLSGNWDSDDFVMKEVIEKGSDIYKELSDKIKKQGIFLITREISEENKETSRIFNINFQN